jgi:outer membrane lipoprotein-sorting protein
MKYRETLAPIRDNKLVLLLALASSIVISLTGCDKKPQGPLPATNENSRVNATGLSASQIIERNRALDNSHDSVAQTRAHISGPAGAEELNAPRELQMTIYRKREPDGRILMLIEFSSPAEERDRDGLVTVFPDGRIEGVRYVQSSGSFIEATDASSEDSLFGLTLQELADGQPDKYDFTLAGDESLDGVPVYRLDGKLKPGSESKFPRTVLLISKQDFAVIQGEFYDNHNELSRRLSVSKFEQVAGHWTRIKWSIDNRARQKKIDFESLNVKYDQNLNDSIFTREHLKKIASR